MNLIRERCGRSENAEEVGEVLTLLLGWYLQLSRVASETYSNLEVNLEGSPRGGGQNVGRRY